MNKSLLMNPEKTTRTEVPDGSMHVRFGQPTLRSMGNNVYRKSRRPFTACGDA